jgi:hypothetical protein
VKLGFHPRDRTHTDSFGKSLRQYERGIVKGDGEICTMRDFTPSTGVVTMDEMDRTCGTDK